MASCRLRGLLLDDPRTHPHHLGQRPVGDTVTVGKAAPAVPPEVVSKPVDVLLELPGEPRLPDAGDADDRDQLRLALLGGSVEQLLDQAHLAVAPDERRLEPDRLLSAAAVRRDPERPVDRDRLGLAFQLVLAGGLVGDRGLGRPSCRLADQDGPRLGRRLDPGGGIDQVAGNHAVALRAQGHRRLAGQHARARCQAGCVFRDRRDEVEGGPHGPLGVVLVRDRCSPDRHDRVADELLHRSAVERDEPLAGLEVAGEELTRVLGIAIFGRSREADQVGEEHRDQPALRRRRLSVVESGACRSLAQARAALAAELDPRRVRAAARTAHGRERAATLAAELPSGFVVGSARGAVHDALPRGR